MSSERGEERRGRGGEGSNAGRRRQLVCGAKFTGNRKGIVAGRRRHLGRQAGRQKGKQTVCTGVLQAEPEGGM